MRKLLFLVSLCLLPFVAFSSTFTSENPISLPTTTTTTTSANNLVIVVDIHGRALEQRQTLRIASAHGGVLGGDVYLGPSPNSAAPCPDAVLKYNSPGTRGTPIRFIKSDNTRPRYIYENEDVNIQFTATRACDDYSVWKVGEYNASLGESFLETTGGTIGQQDSSWFRIMRSPQGQRREYFLMYCPGPFVCPSCPIDRCRAVWVVIRNGTRRLALVNNQIPSQDLRFPLRVYFTRR